jgi:hypothetical protein
MPTLNIKSTPTPPVGTIPFQRLDFKVADFKSLVVGCRVPTGAEDLKH